MGAGSSSSSQGKPRAGPPSTNRGTGTAGAATAGSDVSLNATHVRVDSCALGSVLPPHQVGLVTGPAVAESSRHLPPPASTSPPPGESFWWFAEDLDRPGAWVAYNAESSRRLEAALHGGQNTCTVTLHKRAFVVHLQEMEQRPSEGSMPATPMGGLPGPVAGAALLPHQRVRQVRRALAEEARDPTTGAATWTMKQSAMVDPFDSDADDQDDEGPNGDKGESSSPITFSASPQEPRVVTWPSYPKLTRLCHPIRQAIYTMAMPPASSTHAADANGGVLLGGGKHGQAVEWQHTTGEVLTRYALPVKSVVLNVAYSPSGRLLVVGANDKVARMYVRGEPNPRAVLQGHTHKVYGVSFSSTEDHLVTGSMDCQVRRWDVATGACVYEGASHSSHVFTVVSARQHPSLALSAGDDTLICLHDFRVPANCVVARFTGHTKTIWDLDITPTMDEGQFASCGMDGVVCIWDGRRLGGSGDALSSSTPLRQLQHHTRPVHSVRYLPHGRGLLSCAKDSMVCLTDAASGMQEWTAKASGGSVFRACYDPKLRVMATASADAKVCVWQWEAGNEW